MHVICWTEAAPAQKPKPTPSPTPAPSSSPPVPPPRPPPPTAPTYDYTAAPMYPSPAPVWPVLSALSGASSFPILPPTAPLPPTAASASTLASDKRRSGIIASGPIVSRAPVIHDVEPDREETSTTAASAPVVTPPPKVKVPGVYYGYCFACLSE